MFNMSGHKVEIKGVFPPSPRDEQIKAETGTDVSDLGMINQCVRQRRRQERASDHKLTPDDISMVVWVEDLARVPVIVFSKHGMVLWRDPDLEPETYKKLEQAARLVNDAFDWEQRDNPAGIPS